MDENHEEYIPPKRPPPQLPKNGSNNNLVTPKTTQQDSTSSNNEQPKTNPPTSFEEDSFLTPLPKRAPPPPPAKSQQSTSSPVEQQNSSNSVTTTTNNPPPSQNDPKAETTATKPKPALPPKTAAVNSNANAKTDYRHSQQVSKGTVPPTLPPKPATLRPGKTDWNEFPITVSDTSSEVQAEQVTVTTFDEQSSKSNQNPPRSTENNNTQPATRTEPTSSSPRSNPNAVSNSPPTSNPSSNPSSSPSSTTTSPQASPRTSDAIPPNKVVKEGYLVKKGHKRTNWLIRWFKLTGESLSYYSSSKADASCLKGTIPLNNPTDIQLVDKVDVKKRDNVFVIRVLSQSKEYMIDAQTQTELQLWLAALKSVLKIKHEVIQTMIQEMQQQKK